MAPFALMRINFDRRPEIRNGIQVDSLSVEQHAACFIKAEVQLASRKNEDEWRDSSRPHPIVPPFPTISIAKKPVKLKDSRTDGGQG
jgi:hypothetical protein